MKEFTSIRQFRDVVTSVKRHCHTHNKIVPTLNFTGTVKLHGSNGGLVITPKGDMRIQSRSRTIDISCDNAGFAAWATKNKDHLINLLSASRLSPHFSAARLSPHFDKNITFFGEWCGGNIQDKVALTQAPKHFVLFGAYIQMGPDDGIYLNRLIEGIQDHSIGLYNIRELPPYKITIDFNNPHLAQNQLVEYTAAVDEVCPWAKEMFSVEGHGEGIVWTCDDHPDVTDLWFKTKGSAHASGSKPKTIKIAADPEKIENIRELVNAICPEARLVQGVQALQEKGIELTTKSMGEYLKWVCQDVVKEETDTIVASGFEWKKDINQPVIARARDFFIKTLNEIAGVNKQEF